MNSTVSNSLFHYTHACRQAVVRLKTFYKFHASSPFLLFDGNGELVFFEPQEMHFIRKIPVQFRQNFDFIFNVPFISNHLISNVINFLEKSLNLQPNPLSSAKFCATMFSYHSGFHGH